VAEAAHDAIILMQPDCSIVFWNSGAERILGYGKEEVLGENITNILIPERYIKVFQRYFKSFFLEGKITVPNKIFEALVLQKSQKELPVEVSLSSVNIDNKWIAIGIIRDISQRRALERKLRQMATHDTLTGLINRREIMQQLHHEILRFHRYHSPITLFFIDIDHFKSINDKYGHQIGDDTLVDCANKMHSLMRENDIVGRYGGEEFLVILPETPVGKAYELAERLRSNISHKSNVENKMVPYYTISIGIAELHDDKMSIDAFINLADMAMYKAKQSGRNRICIDAQESHND